jgi:hypothetical protein
VILCSSINVRVEPTSLRNGLNFIVLNSHSKFYFMQEKKHLASMQ